MQANSQQLTLFSAGHLASLIVLPTISVPGQQTSAISGLTCEDLLLHSDRDLSWWRMFQESFQTVSSMRYVLTWNPRITKSGRWFFQLAYSERPTYESASSLWPTPTYSDQQNRQMPPPEKVHITRNGTARYINNFGEQSFLRLSQVVKMWSSPAYQDSKNSTLPASQAERDTLPGDLIRNGEIDPMNPDWEELLMGLPIGWTNVSTPPAISPVSRQGRARSNMPMSHRERAARLQANATRALRHLAMPLSGSKHSRLQEPLHNGWRYTYLGDKLTRPDLRGMQCDPVRRADGKCVISAKMATALVVDSDGKRHVVLRRRLRLNKNDSDGKTR